MNILSGFGGKSSKNVVIRFIADTARASRQIDQLVNKLNAMQTAKTTMAGVGAMGAMRAGAFSWMQQMGGGYAGINIPASILMNDLKKVKDGMAEVATESQNLGSELGELVKRFKGVLAVLYLVFQITKHAVKWGNLVERATIQMELFTGSQEKTAKTMKELTRFAMKTPFKLGETFTAGAMATQFGVNDLLKKGAYGLPKDKTAMDLFAGLGSFMDIHGEVIGLNRAVYAWARGERRMLRAFGPGVQEAHEKSLAEGGKAGSRGYRMKFLEEIGKLPEVMAAAEKHANSLAGMWSTIAGYAEEFWIQIAGVAQDRAGILSLWTSLKSILKDVRDYGEAIMDYIGPMLNEFGAMLGSIFQAVWSRLKVIFVYLYPFFKILVQLLRIVFAIVTFIAQIFAKVFGGLFRLIEKLFTALGGGSLLDTIIEGLIHFVAGLQTSMNLFLLGFDRAIDAIIRKIEELIKALPNLGKWFADLGDDIYNSKLFKRLRGKGVRGELTEEDKKQAQQMGKDWIEANRPWMIPPKEGEAKGPSKKPVTLEDVENQLPLKSPSGVSIKGGDTIYNIDAVTQEVFDAVSENPGNGQEFEVKVGN